MIRSDRHVPSRIASCTDCRVSGTMRDAGTGLFLSRPTPFPGSASQADTLSDERPDGILSGSAAAPPGHRFRAACHGPRSRTGRRVAGANCTSPGCGRATANPIRNEAFRRGARWHGSLAPGQAGCLPEPSGRRSARALRILLIGCARAAGRSNHCRFRGYHRALTVRRGTRRASALPPASCPASSGTCSVAVSSAGIARSTARS